MEKYKIFMQIVLFLLNNYVRFDFYIIKKINIIKFNKHFIFFSIFNNKIKKYQINHIIFLT